MTSTTDDHRPPPPPFAISTALEDRQLEVEQVLDSSTLPEGVEYLGTYPTLERYLRAQLEDQVSAPCQWILDCLDYLEVQRRWESDGSRLFCESGCVYRISIETPEPDPPDPWMPTGGV